MDFATRMCLRLFRGARCKIADISIQVNVLMPLAVAVASICCFASPASSQAFISPASPPVQSLVVVPDMTFSPTKSDIRRFDEYFYFHKADVDYERAFADLYQCQLYGAVALIGGPTPPVVVPLGSDLPQDKSLPNFTMLTALGGIVGDMIIRATIVADVMDDLARGTERRCMMWKGYSRYGTSLKLWKQIQLGTDADRLARLAKLASGPAPLAEALEP